MIPNDQIKFSDDMPPYLMMSGTCPKCGVHAIHWVLNPTNGEPPFQQCLDFTCSHQWVLS